ncbi:integrase [Gossypium australe]|uniref:Integrase n=1 Tax=Gossypium australe TaxID=47621 RepID=A0A5B6WYT2_9ROSI|nr:integrase [Gossypium australe]
MCVDAKREGGSLCFQTTKAVLTKQLNPRLGARNSDVRTQDLVTLLKELNLHQRRWIELLKDHDCMIEYHPGKANVLSATSDGGFLVELQVGPTLLEQIKEKQASNE